MYLLIGIWGSDRRLYSAIKFFLFTLVGSMVMLLGILAVYFYQYSGPPACTPSTWTQFPRPEHPREHAVVDLPRLLPWVSPSRCRCFPFHTWLPDAHTDAPTAASVILAAVLLKMGTYGFIRFSLPILPDATRTFVPMIVALAIIGIVLRGRSWPWPRATGSAWWRIPA